MCSLKVVRMWADGRTFSFHTYTVYLDVPHSIGEEGEIQVSEYSPALQSCVQIRWHIRLLARAGCVLHPDMNGEVAVR